MRRISAINASVSVGFIPAAGSSKSKSRGSVASARAISNRRWTPYAKCSAGTSATAPISTRSSRESASSAAVASSVAARRVRAIAAQSPDVWRQCAPTMTLSLADNEAKSRTF